MRLGVGVLVGVLGAGIGLVAANYAVSVPARGRLPRLSLRPSGHGPPALILLGVAVASGLVCATVGTLAIPLALLPAYCLCAVSAIALAIIDVRVRRLPYALTGVMYGSCMVAFLAHTAATGEVRPLVTCLVAGAVAFLAFLALALALPGQLGLGDVVLVGWIAFSLGWFGWRAAALGLLVGLVMQATVAVVLLARPGPRRMLPMGPALLIGWLAGVVAATW